MTKKKSEFGKINSVDLLNALYYFLGVIFLNGATLLSVGILPTKIQLLTIFGSALSAGFLNIFKSLAKDENGKYFPKQS